MDERSSIFSSDPAAHASAKPVAAVRRGRWPVAFLLSLGIVGAVELGLHFTKWPNPIPYALGRDEYHAVAAQIDRAGSSRVAFVGSSRTRESISIPMLRERFDAAGFPRVSVASYATGGGRAIDFEAVVNRLTRAKPLPHTIVLGMSERDLAGTAWQYDNAPIFWNLHEWRGQFRRRGHVVLEDLPTVLRSTAGKKIRLLGRREQIALRLHQMVLGIGPRETTSPLRGEPTPWHTAGPRKKIDRDDPEMRAKVQMYVARDIRPERFPDTAQISAFERLAATCQRRNVRLIVLELPIAGQLAKEIPTEMSDTYRSIIYRVTEQYGARFVRLRDVDFRATFREFRDPSHTNLDGAEMYTRGLADNVLLPVLKADSDRAKREAKRKSRASAATTVPGTL